MTRLLGILVVYFFDGKPILASQTYRVLPSVLLSGRDRASCIYNVVNEIVMYCLMIVVLSNVGRNVFDERLGKKSCVDQLRSQGISSHIRVISGSLSDAFIFNCTQTFPSQSQATNNRVCSLKETGDINIWKSM
eukprot:Blabericola_migrator_1__7768@NODE_3975_length_1399_cov_28_426426_g2450_i0_p2_GENE_NODE_3975_length_1399_cov_28_426426_g2450_i0NODE_3975_length_1399_cov_28_426426_g2450_i0_p2_ORF_typecomplete_len134_score13_73DUF4331/PF14224_6/0_14_NODE_3975_length_1399_cov_28_426426_g2450_i07251126